jgi:beta-galactosidase GanA
LEKQGRATRLVVQGEPFLMFAGELHNSTCGGYETMRPVWKKLAKKNLNSVIASVSWELVEPEQGKFDFALVDSIITGARTANLKVVLIWFASWKNAGSVYAPSWVKKDYEKYPRAKDEHGNRWRSCPLSEKPHAMPMLLHLQHSCAISVKQTPGSKL